MTNPEIDILNEKAWKQRLLDIQSSYKNALEILNHSESRDYKKGVADSCKVLGYCFWRFSDYSLSLAHSLKALQIYKDLSDLKNEADTLNNIGAVYMFQSDNTKRLEVNLKCKEIRLQVGDLEGVSSSEGNIGETYLEMGDFDNAQKRFESVLNDKNASPQGIAWAYHNIGRIYAIQKNWDKALDFFTKGLEVSLTAKYNVLIVDSYLEITETYLNQNNFGLATINAEKSLEVSRRIGAKDGEKKALYYLSKIYESQGLFEKSLKYHKRFHTKEIEISRDTEIERLKTTQLKVAFDKIEEQKNELIDSIKYAEQIQNAVLTTDQNQKLLTDFFVFYKPKDIVSGDFYWYYEKENVFYICVADCTGHGVPGAFLTMLGTTFLNVIVTINDDISPAEMLDRLRSRLIHSLSQQSNRGNKDGMDITLIKIDKSNLVAEWAGAYNPLILTRKLDKPNFKVDSKHKILTNDSYQLLEIKGDKQPVSIGEKMSPFTNHVIQLQPNDCIYLFSDGYADQFGGKLGKKFMSLNFKKLLLNFQNNSIDEQNNIIETTFEKWKGQFEQIDDVCVLGFKV